MSFSLSAHLFYGFKLEETDDDNDKRESVYDGEHDHRNGNESPSPCAVESVGWHENFRVLGIKSTFREARGYDGSISAVAIPSVDPAWNDQLREWCETYGFVYGEPSWQLAAQYD